MQLILAARLSNKAKDSLPVSVQESWLASLCLNWTGETERQDQCECQRRDKLEEIGSRGFKLEIETTEEHEWHENMRAHPAIPSFQPASFCSGTLLALLMLYVDELRPVLPTFKKRTAGPCVWFFCGEASQVKAQKCKQDISLLRGSQSSLCGRKKQHV